MKECQLDMLHTSGDKGEMSKFIEIGHGFFCFSERIWEFEVKDSGRWRNVTVHSHSCPYERTHQEQVWLALHVLNSYFKKLTFSAFSSNI